MTEDEKRREQDLCEELARIYNANAIVGALKVATAFWREILAGQRAILELLIQTGTLTRAEVAGFEQHKQRFMGELERESVAAAIKLASGGGALRTDGTAMTPDDAAGVARVLQPGHRVTGEEVRSVAISLVGQAKWDGFVGQAVQSDESLEAAKATLRELTEKFSIP